MSVKFFSNKGRFTQVPTNEAAIQIQPSEEVQAIAQQPCIVRCSRSLLILILKLVIFISILVIHYCLTRVISELLKYWISIFCISKLWLPLLLPSPFPATASTPTPTQHSSSHCHSHIYTPATRSVPSLPFTVTSDVTSFAHTLTRSSGWPLLILQSSEYWGL